jgi:CII-binding regulator of phage lambda lysogenization HflD
MITPEFHKKQINKIKRSYENILIDIMFSLLDIEEELESNPFPIESIEERIQKLKENIGKNLKD